MATETQTESKPHAVQASGPNAKPPTVVGSTDLFGVGDWVTYMKVSGTATNRMSFKTIEARITSLNSGVATVKMRNGRTDMVKVKKLTLKGERTELTKMVDAMAGATSEPTPNSKVSLRANGEQS